MNISIEADINMIRTSQRVRNSHHCSHQNMITGSVLNLYDCETAHYCKRYTAVKDHWKRQPLYWLCRGYGDIFSVRELAVLFGLNRTRFYQNDIISACFNINRFLAASQAFYSSVDFGIDVSAQLRDFNQLELHLFFKSGSDYLRTSVPFPVQPCRDVVEAVVRFESSITFIRSEYIF